MIGETGVGKTSLVQRFVKSIYSDKYHMTIGVKIDKKELSVDGKDVTLLLWDLQGEDETFKIKPSFLKGASGFFLVVDRTRHQTLVTAFGIQQMVERELGDKLPFLVLFNKSDLVGEFDMTNEEVVELADKYGWDVINTSAKSGENVNESFKKLTSEMLKRN